MTRSRLSRHAVLAPRNRAAALVRAPELTDIIVKLQAEGKTVVETAEALNARGVGGARWH